MKRVDTFISLPADSEQMRQYLTQRLRDHAQALQQAADGRLLEFVDVTGAYTSGDNDHVIQCAPSAPFTLTIPAPANMRNKRITVKRTNNTTHTITVQPASGTIDGVSSTTLTTAYQAKHFFSDGSAWYSH